MLVHDLRSRWLLLPGSALVAKEAWNRDEQRDHNEKAEDDEGKDPLECNDLGR